jgi:hypothetical protein
MAFRESDLFLQPDPEDLSESFEWKILRPKEGRKLAVTCLSSQKFGTPTHFTPQGTLPHLRGECPWCKAGRDLRWHGYFEAILHPTCRRVIVEMTARAAQQLSKGIEKFKVLRGLDILLERDGERVNSPQCLTVKRINPLPGDLPKEEPILPILKRIWQLKDAEVPVTAEELEAAKQRLIQEINALKEHEDGPDSAWMCQRAKDLAGQLHMFEGNGKR